MKQHFFLPLFVTLAFFSCKSKQGKPETDIEAANQFVQNIWQSNFKKAEELLLKDDTNKQTLDGFEAYFKRRPEGEREKYKKATIILNDIKQLNDSVSIVNYSPDFNKAEKNELKVIRTKGEWLIDLKYTIPHTENIVQ